MSFKIYPKLVFDNFEEVVKWIKYVTRLRLEELGYMDEIARLASSGSTLEYVKVDNATPTTPPVNSTSTNGMAIGNGAVAATGGRAIAIGASYASGYEAIALQISDSTSSYGAHVSNSFCHGYRNVVTETILDTGYGGLIIDGSQNTMTDSDECAIISSFRSEILTCYSYCVILGGESATMTNANDCAIIAGNSNNIGQNIAGTGVYASVILAGDTNSLTSTFGGIQETVACSILSGQNNSIVNSDGCASVSGDFNVISGVYGSAAFGGGTIINKNCQLAHSDGNGGQTSQYIQSITTADGTPKILSIGGSSTPAAYNRLKITSDSTWAFEILVVARRSDADNESAAYKFLGCIDNNAGTTALVGSVTKTVVAEDTAAWDVNVTADDTNDCITITVTGEAAKTINWVAFIRTVEITG